MRRRGGMQLLASGTLAAQVITVAATPLLTRLYTPAAFATLALVVTIANTLGVFAHGRLTVAIAASQSDDIAREAFINGQRLVWLICTVGGVGLATLHVVGVAPNQTFAIIFAGCVCGAGIATLDLHAFYRNNGKAYRISALTSVVRAVMTAFAQVVLFAFGPLGLATGTAIGIFFALGFSSIALKKMDFEFGTVKAWRSLKWLSAIYRDHKQYLFYSAPQALVAALGHNMPPIILAATTNPTFVGHYWLAFRLLVAPISVLGGSYRQVSIAAFKSGGSGSTRLLIRDSLALAGVMAIIAIGLIVLGPWAFSFVFGADWRETASIAAVLVIGYGADLAKVPAICLLQAQHQEKLLFQAELITATIKLSVLAITLNYFSPITSLTMFAASSAICAIVLMIVGLRRPHRGAT